MTQNPGRGYDMIVEGDEATVVTEYTPTPRTDAPHQTEAQLEAEFIRILRSQAYEYLPITSEAELIANLRTQLERLNSITFTDSEWQRFFTGCIANASDTITDKTRRIQEDHVQVLTRDDGSTKNVILIDKDNIHRNTLQVINQYETPAGHLDEPGTTTRATRYDVTILVNGLPLVHVELKRRGVPIREAFNQIERYQRDSFWAGSGLFEYIHIFVISNGTQTKYYSNTTRDLHLKEHAPGRRRAHTSHSFEFTMWWADAANTPIEDLSDFAKTFFARHTLLSILTKYCVFTAKNILMVMRPYQIVATERITERIKISSNYKKAGTTDAGGYIWHTTGSGKTLTSFKTAQLVAQNPDIDRVIFVVDRKDLDHQTKVEYQRFSPGSVNGNTSTAELRRQLTEPVGAVLSSTGGKIVTNQKILVTTIQKLNRFITSHKKHPIYDQHVVIIFDECHRSQFGAMHQAITKSFKKYHIFGFTGTPIFAQNATKGRGSTLTTTQAAFGDKLHTYTIVDAISDKNVLPFRLSYINTMHVGEIEDRQVLAIEPASARMAPERLTAIAQYILDNYATQTKSNKTYHVDGQVRHGFNAMFATESIPAARAYYSIFKRLQESLPPAQRLKIAMIYSFARNESPDESLGFMSEEDFDPSCLDADSRAGLDEAIADYNAMFGTNFSSAGDQFQQYYDNLTTSIKERRIDLVIVVNMFLTGFDATTLNTLFVDKNLRMHGLIQAFSRTNRILNSIKTHGNIVCFRNLESATDEAIALFGNKDACGVVLLKPYEVYYHEYCTQVEKLQAQFPPGQRIIGEENERSFVQIYGQIRRLINILASFEQFNGQELISDGAMDDYAGRYLAIREEWINRRNSEKEDIHDDLVFEIELIKQVEVNIDYILGLVRDSIETNGTGHDQEIREKIRLSMSASPTLRDKRDLVEAFLDTINLTSDIDQQWTQFITGRARTELEAIVTDERLNSQRTHALLGTAFREGTFTPYGQSLTRILPPMNPFSAQADTNTTRKRVAEKLTAFFHRFQAIISTHFSTENE